MLRFFFFLIVFYIIFQGIKIFIRSFSKMGQTNSYRNKSTKNSNNRNIEEAEFTELESKIHTQDKENTDGKT